MAQFDGPTWADVATAAQYLHERFHVSTEFRIVPPVRRLDGKGYSSWVAVARVCGRGADKGWQTAEQESYGQGGAVKSAPAALLRCLLRAQATLEAREVFAAGQAAF